MASAPGPLPQSSFPAVVHSGALTQPYAQYFAQLDATVRSLVKLLFGSPTQLVNAANDAAAAAAGVQVGQSYRNGSILMIRVQ